MKNIRATAAALLACCLAMPALAGPVPVESPKTGGSVIATTGVAGKVDQHVAGNQLHITVITDKNKGSQAIPPTTSGEKGQKGQVVPPPPQKVEKDQAAQVNTLPQKVQKIVATPLPNPPAPHVEVVASPPKGGSQLPGKAPIGHAGQKPEDTPAPSTGVLSSGEKGGSQLPGKAPTGHAGQKPEDTPAPSTGVLSSGEKGGKQLPGKAPTGHAGQKPEDTPTPSTGVLSSGEKGGKQLPGKAPIGHAGQKPEDTPAPSTGVLSSGEKGGKQLPGKAPTGNAGQKPDKNVHGGEKQKVATLPVRVVKNNNNNAIISSLQGPRKPTTVSGECDEVLEEVECEQDMTSPYSAPLARETQEADCNTSYKVVFGTGIYVQQKAKITKSPSPVQPVRTLKGTTKPPTTPVHAPTGPAGQGTTAPVLPVRSPKGRAGQTTPSIISGDRPTPAQVVDARQTDAFDDDFDEDTSLRVQVHA